MRALLERLEAGGESLTEETANSLYKRTPRFIRTAAQGYVPRLVRRSGPHKGTMWWETKGKTAGKTWYQTIKAHPRANSKVQLATKMDVTMKCTCPAWVFTGAQWWAIQQKYLYGLPRRKAIAPKMPRNLKPRRYLCKHLVAVIEQMKKRKIKVEI